MARNITDRVEVPRWHFPKQILWITIIVCLAIGFSLLGLSQTLWHSSTPSINVEPPKVYPLISAPTSTPSHTATLFPKIIAEWEIMENADATNFVFLDKTGEVIVATGYGNIIRTEDGGKTWVSVTNQGGGNLVFDSATQTLYAYSTKGILKSADRGKTWQLTNNAGLGQLYIDILQKDLSTGKWRNIGYHQGASPLAIDRDGNLSVGAPEGIFMSRDGGQSWSQIGPRLSNERLIVKEGVKYILSPQFSQDSQMWFNLPEGFAFVENGFDPPWSQIKTYRDWEKWLEEEWGDRIHQIQKDPREKLWSNNLPVSPASCGYVFAEDANNASIVIGALLPVGTTEIADQIQRGERKPPPDTRPFAKDVIFFLSLDGGKSWREINPPPPIDGKGLDGSYGRGAAGTPSFGIISTGNYLKIFVGGVTGNKVPPTWQTTILIK